MVDNSKVHKTKFIEDILNGVLATISIFYYGYLTSLISGEENPQ